MLVEDTPTLDIVQDIEQALKANTVVEFFDSSSQQVVDLIRMQKNCPEDYDRSIFGSVL
jgi:hypothetical protein